MIALLDTLGIARVYDIGVSMGGMLGQNLARRFPHRLASPGLVNTLSTYDEAGRQTWRHWVEAVKHDGVKSLHDILMSRWFTPQRR